jgi:WD40 repeat protein
MKLLQNRSRMCAVALTAAIGMFTASCGHTAGGVGVSVKPADLPIQFAVDLTFGPNGAISISGSVGIITEIGVISVQGSLETNLQPTSNETLLIIKHHLGSGLAYSVYRIRTGEAVTVTLNGHTVITVTNRKILINAANGSVQSIKIQNASPPPPAVANPAPVAPGGVRLLRTIRSPGISLDELAWSPDGSLLASGGSSDDSVAPTVSDIWRASDGALIARHEGQIYYVGGISWSPDGRYIATSGQGGGQSGADSVQIWDPLTGRTATVITLPDIENVDWSSDSHYIVISGTGDTPTVLSAASGSQVSSYDGYVSMYDPAQWAFKGSLVASGSIIWNGLSGREVRAYANGGAESGSFANSCWSPNDDMIVSGTQYGSLIMWDATTGATIWQDASVYYGGMVPLSWSPDGKYIAVVTAVPTILSAATGREIAYIGGSSADSYFANSVDAIAWSPNGQYIATASGGVIQIWRAPGWS